MTRLASVSLAVFALVALEALLSRRNERRLRALGAVEPADDVYRAMAVAYPGAFILMMIEGAVRAPASERWWAMGVGVFIVAKALKYWTIATLGYRWTFRVLVLPGRPLVGSGPYRYVRHPNYVAVVGELIGVALMLSAALTGVLALAGFGTLLIRRIAVEDRALRATAGQTDTIPDRP